MEYKVYNQEGQEAGKVTLPGVFETPWNSDLVHQVAVAQQANKRTPVAHTKDRGDVRGGGKKPWRQKGTGRARHGSSRSPIWIGGGVTFGPRNEKDYSKKINKKMRVKALNSVLSHKLKDGEIMFVDSINIPEPKASVARGILNALGGVEGFEAIASKKKNAVLIALPSRNEAIEISFRNFGNVKVEEVRNLNVLDSLTFKNIVLVSPKEALEFIEKREGKEEDKVLEPAK